MKVARVSPPMVGEVFQERYRIVSEIGAGGFGTVYKGVQLATGQEVAIKVLRLMGARDAKVVEKRVARLEREMRLCAQLHHPNIVGLIDFGRTGDGGVFSVFEFVPGKNLEELLIDGALEPQEARHLMLEVLDALACAHAQGVIHRDLKPSNIMVISTGARRNALVLDFGIGAVSEDVQGVDRSRLTATNEVVGTIAYAAPEQLLSRPTSPASDIYSWGLVFLECLMGAPAIQGASLMDMLLKQVGAEVLMPRALEKHELGKILRAAVAKKVDERPGSASELMKRLEACNVADLRREDMRRPEAPPSDRAQPSVAPDSPVVISPPSASGPQSPSRMETMQVEFQPRARLEAVSPLITQPAERRQVTMVCVAFSVEGADSSTPLAALDVEDADPLLFWGHDACAAIAARALGQPVGALGDQILFRFGFPAADEHDARRAARASLEMAAEIERESQRLRAARQRFLQIRIAIHTGLTVSQAPGIAGSHQLAASLGITPHVAARLAAAAAPGEILVSASTQRLLRHSFSLEPLGARDGAAGPVEAYRLGSAVPAPRAALPADGPATPLVGREREIELLLQRWSEVEQGRGQVVLVTGEAGIGKSRLLLELANRLRGVPHRWLECRSAPEDQNSALHPIIDMLGRMLELGEEEAAAARRGKLEGMLRSLDFKLDDAIPLFSKLLGIALEGVPRHDAQGNMELSPQQAKEQLLNALLSLLFELSEKEPLVIVAEDLHWTDPTTLELFSLIVQEASSARVLAVFSARPTFVPQWSLAGVTQVQLSRLGREQIQEMVAQLAGASEPPPSSMLNQIADRTDGVPLFVEELTRMMIESGILADRTGEVLRPRSSLPADVPVTLRDLLTARLDRLGRAKATAQIAAALGRELSYELLAAVSPLGDSAQLREDLDALVAADLVHRRRRPRGHSYAFKHALIRDTAYESMLRRTRQKVHADIARALVERFPETVAARPDLLALHCAEAGQKKEAIEHILQAAEASIERMALAEAAGYAQQALGWLESIEGEGVSPETELRVHGALINAVFALKGPGTTELDGSISRVQALFGEVKDSPVVIPLLARLALHFQLRARFAASTELARRCLSLAEQVHDSAAQISALAIVAQNLFFTARYDEARSAAERALALYDARAHARYAIANGGLDFSVLCYGPLSFSLWFMGLPDQALAVARKGLEQIEQINHPNSTAMALLYLGSVHRYRREIGEMQATMGRLQEISQRHGLYLAAFSGVIFTSLAGDVATPRGILATIRSYGQEFAMPYWYSVVAEAEAAAGRWDAALDQLDECIRTSEATGEVYYMPELLRLKGTYLWRRDASAAAEAEACLRKALDLSREHESRMCALRAAVALAPILGATGRREEAHGMLLSASSVVTEGHSLPDMEEARALLAELRA